MDKKELVGENILNQGRFIVKVLKWKYFGVFQELKGGQESWNVLSMWYDLNEEWYEMRL